MNYRTVGGYVLAVAAMGAMQLAGAAEWSDTSIGYRYSNKFAEPFNPADISKNIVSLTHVSGYKFGGNFLNVDMLMSDKKDNTAQEVYVVYRHTLDLGKVTGKSFAFGPVKSTGVTGGFDFNAKNDPGYASKKRMLVLGPTFGFDVPGFLNVGAYLLHESNRPNAIPTRYTYDLHPMLGLVWGIPVAGGSVSFEGFMNYIASKGKNEFGGSTAPETNIDAALMYDLGPALGFAKNTFRAGVGYQYWRNKFGNLKSVPGSLAKTPMLKVDYHF
ncbi:MAG: outer envelope protein [Ramlibacter sp.]|nr:outer envelope protein [Ramlibacter sp.]